MKKSIKFNLICFIFLTLIFSACTKSHSGMMKGELHDYTGLDGCGMLIDLDNETVLEPVNLNDFQADVNIINGQEIWVKCHEVNGGSVCMVGKIVVIDDLENQ